MTALDAARRLASVVLDVSIEDAQNFSNNLTMHEGYLSQTTACGLWILITVLLLLLLALWRKHRTARRLMEGGRCNLPTVLWRPRFINYAPDQDEDDTCSTVPPPLPYEGRNKKKMASSSITNMLPRMGRLGGPYGMYGTIYGLSTRVVHVGHPVPARTILSGMGNTSSSNSRQATSPKAGQKRTSMFISSSGASKSPAYDHFKNFSGDGVFTADGDEWKAKRASVIHCLLRGCTGDKSEGMRRLEREANNAADGFIGNIERGRQQLLDGDRVQTDGCINIVPVLQKSTIGLVYRFITHHDIDLCRQRRKENDATTDVMRQFPEKLPCESESLATVTPKSSTTSLCSLADASPRSTGSDQHTDTETASLPSRLLGSYLKSVTHIRMIILAQSRSFWFLMPRWVYRSFSPMFRAEENTMGPIRDFARAACVNAQPGSPLALLRDRPSHGATSSDSADVSKAMLDEAITLLFAGQDTSAATLSWTLHLLSLYPGIQEKLASEISSCLQEQRESIVNEDATKAYVPFFTKQFISNMPYLDAVIKESMRLYPVAPFVVRRLPQDVTIPPESRLDSSTVLPEGSLACVWIYALHRNPQLWHRPDDFIPERWIDPQLKDLDEGQSSGAFMPFANGPRNCVGQPLAHVILRIMLARIVNTYTVVDKKFEASTVDGTDADAATNAATHLRKDMQAGFTVLPSGGVRLSLRPRALKSASLSA